MRPIKLILGALLVCGLMTAQSLQSQNENTLRLAAGDAPIFRVNVTERTTTAINYRHRSGATKIDFRGTQLLPNSEGEAKVRSKQGYIEVDVKFKDLRPANSFGAEYLTYVLWAITPEGRTSNLGEILLNGTKSKLKVTTEMQVFGLVVTAEPYYSVTMPSDLVVMENVVREDTKGKFELIDAKYELLERGQYQQLANPLALKLDKKVPLELYEARNAVQIARSMGAAEHATETFQKAEATLARAEAYQARKAGKKPVTMTAREAVQTAEDSRAIAVKRQEDLLASAERQRSADREELAEQQRIAAQEETERVSREAAAARIRAQQDADRIARQNEERAAASLVEADRVRRETDARMMAANATANRLEMETAARELEARNEAERLRLESDSRMLAANAEAERLRTEMEAQRAANAANLESSARLREQMEAEKIELRSRLLRQFNEVLQTQDSARGLIVNMSDVLFDTGQHTLRPQAREKLAKVAGIVASHPGLTLVVEGHTDSVGGEVYNQLLSERRGGAVRDYLVGQGISASSVSAKGMGKGHPVAPNETAAGRQQNRRVEIVISGEAIGTTIGRVF
jgi:outer membrane protein OmpA-like peptidoglycan-associated protein